MARTQASGKSKTYAEWMEGLQQDSPGTAKVYRSGVSHFLASVYGPKESTETLAPRYLRDLATDKRTYCEDLVAYVRAERKDNTPPKTIQSRTAGVKKFIRRCSDVELDESQRDELKEALGKDHAAVTDKELLDRNTLREILSHLEWRCPKCRSVVKNQNCRALVDEANVHTKTKHGFLTSSYSIEGVVGLEESVHYFEVGCPVPASVCGKSHRARERDVVLHNLYVHIAHNHKGELHGRSFREWKAHMGLIAPARQ